MQIAIDKLIEETHLLKNLGRIGLVVNQASTTSTFIPTANIILHATKKTSNVSLNAIFGPQHGYLQTEQDNMKETEDSFFLLDDETKVPLFSLYSKTREPLKEQLEDIDTLVLDLKDVGCRVYTYMLTLAGCLRSAQKYGKRVVVLDRPNPIGLSYKKNNEWLRVEGNCLDTQWHSFVGWYSIPMRHGLTLGELGNLFVQTDKMNVDYQVIPVNGLTRETSLEQIRKENWVMPSPNLPTWLSSYFFPAFVCLEGTNVSEGRGSTVPFELIGAPWLNVRKCIEFLKEHESLFILSSDKTHLPSNMHKQNNFPLMYREHHFRPTFNKHAGEVCAGLYFGVLEPERVNLFALGMCFLAFCNSFHKDKFVWSTQTYEYNFSDLPIHLILGTDKWTSMFASHTDTGNKLQDMLALSQKEAHSFAERTQAFHIY